MPATTGVAADVPPTSVGSPPLYTQKLSPTAETSGKPAPVWLNHLAGGSLALAASMYRAMCGRWNDGAAWRSEKPPPEKVAPVGAKALVAPTAVTWRVRRSDIGALGGLRPKGHGLSVGSDLLGLSPRGAKRSPKPSDAA